MSAIPKPVAAAQLTASAATYYTTPAGARSIIKALSFTNTSASTTYTVTVYLVPSGGSASASNVIADTKAIAPKETWICNAALNEVLEAGGTLQALASIAAIVTMQGAVMEIT